MSTPCNQNQCPKNIRGECQDDNPCKLYTVPDYKAEVARLMGIIGRAMTEMAIARAFTPTVSTGGTNDPYQILTEATAHAPEGGKG